MLPGDQPPWHMWGTSTIVTVELGGISGAGTSQQLLRINYRRPETFHFFFAGEIIDGPSSGLVQGVQVDWQLQFGVGRAVFDSAFLPAGGGAGQVEGFGAQFRWQVPGGVLPGQQPNNKKFATRVLSPILDDSAATPDNTRTAIDHIVAQDIQLSANVFATSVAAGQMRVQLTAFFAPKVHVRPDWWREVADPEADAVKFQGGEVEGS